MQLLKTQLFCVSIYFVLQISSFLFQSPDSRYIAPSASLVKKVDNGPLMI